MTQVDDLGASDLEEPERERVELGSCLQALRLWVCCFPSVGLLFPSCEMGTEQHHLEIKICDLWSFNGGAWYLSSTERRLQLH